MEREREKEEKSKKKGSDGKNVSVSFLKKGTLFHYLPLSYLKKGWCIINKCFYWVLFEIIITYNY